jgi:predicted nucleotidyltransferase component of viral defense system
MSIQIIQDRLAFYQCQTALEEEQALREMTQEIVLAGLGRTDFFQHAGFQGGTCLRIFHGLPRFSEDLDFALKAPDLKFNLSPYLETVRKELTAFGYALEIDDRSKLDAPVQMAFLKDDSIGNLLSLSYRPASGPLRKLRVKLEVDTRPPAGATFEISYFDFPFPSAATLLDLQSLFAGKIHALLCREYIKGRDWYDFIWYTSRKTSVNFTLLSAALNQIGPWKNQNVSVDREWCVGELQRKIESIDWKAARQDVQRFIKPHELPSLDLWGTDFFTAQCKKLV